MRVLCNEYGIDYVFGENRMMEIVLDTSDVYSAFLNSLYLQSNIADSFIILSDQEKELRFDKVAEIISDPFAISVNDRKILGRIYQDMTDHANNSMSEQVINAHSVLEKLIIDICDDSEYPMTYEPSPELTDLLKLFKVHINLDDEDIANKLISYVKISHRILGTAFFVFINIRDYLNDELMKLFCRSFSYENVRAMMIERHEYNRIATVDRLIIDKDLCLIYN